MAIGDRQKSDRLALIVNQVIESLERGVKPWIKPWDAAADGDPVNLTTGKKYRGANVLTLGFLSPYGGSDNRWATYRQAQAMGLAVRKHEHGAPVFFFSPHVMDDRQGRTDAQGNIKKVTIPVIKTSTAFHVSQLEEVDGKIPPLTPPDPAKAPWRTPAAIERIKAAAGIEIREGGSRAAWSPTHDLILMPRLSDFKSIDGHNATLLHEYSHSTGHSARLNRDLGGRYGDKSYSMEELIAEFSSMMTCQALGLPYDIEHHASYLDSWASLLKDGKNHSALWKAASMAQAASDYILLSWEPEYAKAHAVTMAAELAAEMTDGTDATPTPQAVPPTVHAVLMPSPAPPRSEPTETRDDGLKPYEYFDGVQLVTIRVPFVAGDRVRTELGQQGTVESIMRHGQSVEVRWDGAGSRADIMSASDLMEVVKPSLSAGAAVTDGRGHAGIVVDAQAVPAVAWEDGPKARALPSGPQTISAPDAQVPAASAEAVEDAAMAARIVAGGKSTAPARSRTSQTSFDF